MIEYIQIFGERNSGTNYLRAVLEKNLMNVEVGYSFGWKHGFPNFTRLRKEKTSQTLFLVLFKDPYSWLVSMNNKPHHAPQLFGLSFSEFIRSEWACYQGENYTQRAKTIEQNPLRPEEEMMRERHPWTGERIENVIKLRVLKTRSYLQLCNLVEHSEKLNYENLLNKPADIISHVVTSFGIAGNSEFVNPTGHYGKNPNQKFDRKDYFNQRRYLDSINKKDLKFINEQLSFSLEKKIGYKKVSGKVSM